MAHMRAQVCMGDHTCSCTACCSSWFLPLQPACNACMLACLPAACGICRQANCHKAAERACVNMPCPTHTPQALLRSSSAAARSRSQCRTWLCTPRATRTSQVCSGWWRTRWVEAGLRTSACQVLWWLLTSLLTRPGGQDKLKLTMLWLKLCRGEAFHRLRSHVGFIIRQAAPLLCAVTTVQGATHSLPHLCTRVLRC